LSRSPAPAAADTCHDRSIEYGAIRLFLERAKAADPRFVADQAFVELIAATWRRLDGIPLAIELAAAHAPALGVEGLAARLDDRFRLLTGGRRTALPRHQTLRATLDWSYELLTAPEREILQRLAVFAGAFVIGAVRAVVAAPKLSDSTAFEGVTSLLAKSLIQTERAERLHYRLLDTTRAYALEKLGASGGIQAVASRHANYYRDLFERAEDEEKTLPAADWLMHYGWHMDNASGARLGIFTWRRCRNRGRANGGCDSFVDAPVVAHRMPRPD
jgi:predicted ATPase